VVKKRRVKIKVAKNGPRKKKKKGGGKRGREKGKKAKERRKRTWGAKKKGNLHISEENGGSKKLINSVLPGPGLGPGGEMGQILITGENRMKKKKKKYNRRTLERASQYKVLGGSISKAVAREKNGE